MIARVPAWHSQQNLATITELDLITQGLTLSPFITWLYRQLEELTYGLVCFCVFAAAAAKLLQSCPTLCDPIDGSPQAPLSLEFSRQEHWSGLPFPSLMHESEKWKWSRSVVSDLAIPWTAAYQAPLSMGFSRQESWSGVPLPSPPASLETT